MWGVALHSVNTSPTTGSHARHLSRTAKFAWAASTPVLAHGHPATRHSWPPRWSGRHRARQVIQRRTARRRRTSIDRHNLGGPFFRPSHVLLQRLNGLLRRHAPLGQAVLAAQDKDAANARDDHADDER